MYNDEEELKKKKNYNNALSLAHDFLTTELAAKANNSKSQKIYKEQEQIFRRYLSSERERDIKKFNKKSAANLSKEKSPITNLNGTIVQNIEKKLIAAVERPGSNISMNDVEKIVEMIRRNNSKDALNYITSQYKDTLNMINSINKSIENQKQESAKAAQMPVDDKPKLTIEQEENLIYQNRLDTNFNKLANGPKKNGLLNRLRGKDDNYKDMSYLYGLSEDIFALMMADQHVNPRRDMSDKVNLQTTENYHPSNMEEKTQKLFEKYGVNSVEGLMNKYENIRNKYYEEYKKLNPEQKKKYSINDNSNTILDSSIAQLDFEMRNEGFAFPPSKDEMISIMNRRIINSEKFRLIPPSADKEAQLGEPDDLKEYENIKDKYKNLTKNMNLDEMKELYDAVNREISNKERLGEDLYAHRVVMQKMFCELVFSKKHLEFTTMDEYNAQLGEISKAVLQEQPKFPTHKYKGDVDEATRQIENKKEEQQARDSIKEQEQKQAYDHQKQEYDKKNGLIKTVHTLTNQKETVIEQMVEEELKNTQIPDMSDNLNTGKGKK